MIKWRVAVLNPGDHIRVKRDHYYHHGIFIGDNQVIHFTGEQNDSINNKENVKVRKTSIEFFLKNSVAEKAFYSGKDEKYLRKPREILEIAEKSIGEGNYNLVFNNCEDFVERTIYKTGVKKLKFHLGHFLGRVFFKVTGIIQFMLIIKPKYYYESLKAKRESKDIKGGAIIISNHSSSLDYFTFIFRYFFHNPHAMVGELIYNRKSLRHLCNLFETINVDRNEVGNVDAYIEAKRYLKNGKSVIIFPEGRFEDNPGEIENIKTSAIVLSYETNKPIIPYYINGKYGTFKRSQIIAGEKIYVRDLVKGNELTPKDIEEVKAFIIKKLKALKHQQNAYIVSKTKKLFASNLIYQDISRYTAIPLGFLIFMAKKHYIGDKKKIKNAMKERCLLAPNHTSMCDVVFMYMYFMQRRLRIFALDKVFEVPFVSWFMKRSGVIIYNRDSNGGFDLRSFRETSNILEGNGCVVMFPQGHISKTNHVDGDTKPGLAMHSLRSNAPIIPIIFSRVTGPFRLVHILIGDPIYPEDYKINNELPSLEEYNNIVTSKLSELQVLSRKIYPKKEKQNEKSITK